MASCPTQPTAGGVPDVMKGAEYQKKLIELYSLNAFNKSLDFKCWTEDSRAGKFDDVIISHEIGGGVTEYTFLQAKQKVKPEMLDYQSFSAEKNFQVAKYFESFLEIEKTFKINNVDVKEVIIATNNLFPAPKNDVVTFTNPNNNSKLGFKVVKKQEIFDGFGSTYAFVTTNENLKCLKSLLAPKFYSNFDPKIQNFMTKFLIVTDLRDNQIENVVEFGILKQINDFSLLKSAKLQFQEYFRDWLLNKNQNGQWKPIDKKKLSDLFDAISESKKIQNEKLKFEKFHPDLEKFVSNSVGNRILIFETAPSETFWGTIRVRDLNKSFFYLNSQFEDEIFQLALGTLKKSNENQEICLVIECVEDFNSFMLKFWKNFESVLNEKKNVKLIAICEGENSKEFENYTNIVQNETLCGELTDDSLNFCLDKPVAFQGSSLILEALISAGKIKSTPLKELNNLGEMREKLMKPDIYVPRSMFRKIYLGTQLLEDFTSKTFKEHLCFSKDEYDDFINNGPKNSPVHWVKKVYSNAGVQPAKISHLVWRKSNQSVGKLRSYIKKNEFFDLKEEHFLSNFAPINLISGQAGMGKSSFFENLAYNLKKQFPSCWVQNFKLQAYFKELNELETKFQKKEIKRVDFGSIRKFFCEKFLKLKSSLVLTIFEELLEGGKVFLLLDGYDEIAECYKDTVIAIASAFLEISADSKIYLSTRPEWSDSLEEKFLQFVYWFHPFTQSDQIQLIQTLWVKDDSWVDFIKSILQNINKCLTKQQQTYTGIPLITKLVGEFFMEELQKKNLHNALASNLISKSYSLVDLMERFVTKHFEICCTTRLGIDEFGPSFQIEMNDVEMDHMMLALQIIFPKCIKNFFPNFNGFDKKSKLRLLKSGLVYEVNKAFMFYHQTVAEYLVALFLKNNCKDTQVLKFIFEEVLKKLGYQMIRMFLNDFIADLIKAENKILVERLIVKRKNQILNVAAREGNLKTFNALLDVLMESYKPECCCWGSDCCICSKNAKIKSILMCKDQDRLCVFYNLLANCDVTEEIFEKLEMKFEIGFVRKVLLSKSGKGKLSLMSGAACHEGNYDPLVKWIFKEFSGDSKFIKKILITKDQVGDDILHKMVDDFELASFIARLNELKCLEDFLKEEILSKLILWRARHDGRTFIQRLIENLRYSNINDEESYNGIVKILEWIHQNTNCLSDLYSSEDKWSETLIFFVAECFESRLLQFIEISVNWLNPTEFLTHKATKDKLTFLSSVVSGARIKNVPLYLEILDYLKQIDAGLLDELVNYADIFADFKYRYNDSSEDALKKLLLWFAPNIPRFDKNCFLHQMFENAVKGIGNTILEMSSEDDPTFYAMERLMSLKEISAEFFPQIVTQQKNFLFDLCSKFQTKSFLVDFIQKVFTWTDLNFENFCKTFLISVGEDGNHTILSSFIWNDEHDQAASAVIATLEWIKQTDFGVFHEIVMFENPKKQNLLQQICDYAELGYKFLPNVIQTLVIWLQNNFSSFNREEFLNHRDEDGNSLIWFCKSSYFGEIKKWLMEFDRNLFQNLILDPKGNVYKTNKSRDKLSF